MPNSFRDWTPEMVADYNRRHKAAVKAADKAFNACVGVNLPLSKISLMTLTLTGKCKGCGNKISKESEFCPSCISPPKPPKKRKPLLNKTEARFLARLKGENPSQYIGCQNITFLLAHDCRYTPDFWHMTANGLMFYEVKGPFIREDSIIKLKAAAAHFTMFRFTLAQESKDGKWTIKTIPPL